MNKKRKKRKKYTVRNPLVVPGGIRAQAAQGSATRNWWSQRWIEALENFRIGARLGRGRSYAAAGQVSELRVATGLVTARVQGVSDEPYNCRMQFAVLAAAAEKAVLQQLRAQPMLIARLLVADLPPEVEEFFKTVDVPFFPRRQHDVQSRCSCPDYANPCKHLAALYYLLGEAIALNPLMLLQLRGLTREHILGAQLGTPQVEPLAPLVMDAAAAYTAKEFYGRVQPPFEDYGQAVTAITSAPLLYRLGPLPFWRSRERFTATLEQLYARTHTPGMTVWSGELLDLRREEEKVIVKGANLQLKGRRMRMDY